MYFDWKDWTLQWACADGRCHCRDVGQHHDGRYSWSACDDDVGQHHDGRSRHDLNTVAYARDVDQIRDLIKFLEPDLPNCAAGENVERSSRLPP